MIKRTLLFTNPVYLKTHLQQLQIHYPKESQQAPKSVPIEDIGLIVLESPQITLTHALLTQLLSHQIALVSCDEKHMPTGLFWPLEGHSEQSERMRHQIAASVPLQKNLWQQTVMAKINNQARVLSAHTRSTGDMLAWANKVQSGDSTNLEATAAIYYWKNFTDNKGFFRDTEGSGPNKWLNYGYAILRAMVARALVCSGLMPTLGIFHRNKYNPYCLADDVMEPYRPYVDHLVLQMIDKELDDQSLSIAHKQHLLALLTLDVSIDNKTSPLQVALSRTSNSLYECYTGKSRKLLYPTFDL